MTDKQTTRDKVEAWLQARPKELILYDRINVEETTANERVVGKLTPIIIRGGYEITMNFKSATWEDDDE